MLLECCSLHLAGCIASSCLSSYVKFPHSAPKPHRFRIRQTCTTKEYPSRTYILFCRIHTNWLQQWKFIVWEWNRFLKMSSISWTISENIFILRTDILITKAFSSNISSLIKLSSLSTVYIYCNSYAMYIYIYVLFSSWMPK